MIEAEVVHHAGAELGEGCVWSPVEELLIWVDINAGIVHRFDHSTGTPAGKRSYGDSVGSVAPRAGGGLALALGTTVALTSAAGDVERVIPLLGEPVSNRANDGAVDPAGRLFQGTMSRTDMSEPVGALHRVDPDGSTRRVIDGVRVSNGIGWSPDNTIMYYIDTLTFRIDRFDYDLGTGEICGRRPLLEFDGSSGGPDGMTVDSEGCLWVAFFGGYHVQRFSPDGERLEVVVTPGAPQTTCCCFGGPDLDTLYVTTAREHFGTAQAAAEPNSGALFAADVDVTGSPTHLFAG